MAESGKNLQYNKYLDPKWRFRPTYIDKMLYVEKFIESQPKSAKIIDIGCREGAMVKKFKAKGYNIIGVDNAEECISKHVKFGDVTALREKDSAYDVALCLDVIEHLPFADQEKAIGEIRRILKSGGLALISLPNLAHIACRVYFLLTGKLLRPSAVERHKGERPIAEYIQLFKRHGFKIVKRKGMFPTLPLISIATYFFPEKALPLHRIENRLFGHPNWCLLNILLLSKER
jgi:2-polyprenyl-3-methyl-5-hydroxy-6-metoxy-1,4-benzoquinol methylase